MLRLSFAPKFRLLTPKEERIMCKFTQQELEEIFRMLERAGMNPMWCDTPVPYYDVNIPAGIPTDIEMRSSLNSKY